MNLCPAQYCAYIYYIQRTPPCALPLRRGWIVFIPFLEPSKSSSSPRLPNSNLVCTLASIATTTMASSAHPPFGSRSAYASGKLPDRSLNPLPFSASAFSRHRGLGAQTPGTGDFGNDAGKSAQQQQPPPPPAHSQSHMSSQDASNPLNRLTEEQREEINEAVRISPDFAILVKPVT